MTTDRALIMGHPAGEQPLVEGGKPRSVVADTFAGRVHMEWEAGERAAVTPLGQLPFFIEYLKQGGLFDGWVAGCPLYLTSPNAPSKRDILGTVMLSVLAGHRRYAHITTLRCDPVNPPLLGMAKVVSEDAVRRALSKIAEEAGRAWLQEQLDYCTRPLLREPWILDVDTTVKPLYGHQEGAVVGYNPKKPGRPSHTYHSYILANLRLVLEVEVQAGNQHAAKHSAPGLWTLLDRLGVVRGIARQHLVGERQPFRRHDQCNDHLHAVAAVVTRIPVPTLVAVRKRRIALEIGTGQVVEQDVERNVEQVAPTPDQMVEQRLFVFEQPIVTAVELVDLRQSDILAQQVGHGAALKPLAMRR